MIIRSYMNSLNRNFGTSCNNQNPAQSKPKFTLDYDNLQHLDPMSIAPEKCAKEIAIYASLFLLVGISHLYSNQFSH